MTKSNLFILNTDYQFTLAVAAINALYSLDHNIILFFYRKSDLIKILRTQDFKFRIYFLNSSESYNLRLVNGLINELKRIFNYRQAMGKILGLEFDNIFISQEEKQYLAIVQKIKRIDTRLIHLEEGNVINILSTEVSSISINESKLVRFIKTLREKMRLLYFGKIELDSSKEYGHADFYDGALILNYENLITNLEKKEINIIPSEVYVKTLNEIYSFDSLLINRVAKISKSLFIITDGESSKEKFNQQVYQEIIVTLTNAAVDMGYKVFLKKHPIHSGYLDKLTAKLEVINENLPAEYYFTRLHKTITVIGGSSTSLAISKRLGIPTFSYLKIYTSKVSTTPTVETKSLLDYLERIEVHQLSKLEDFHL